MRTEPTQDELRRAWQHCRRDTWPCTYEEAMADALLSRLVRITAMHPPRPLRKTADSAPRVRLFDPVPRPGAQRPLPLPSTAPAVIDRKRAAAGDRDDD